MIGEADPTTSDVGVGKKVPFLSIGKNQNVELLSLPLAVGASHAVLRIKPNIAHSSLAGAGPDCSDEPTDTQSLISGNTGDVPLSEVRWPTLALGLWRWHLSSWVFGK